MANYKHTFVKNHIVSIIDTKNLRIRVFKDILNEIDITAKCEACGGLPYDIEFKHKGKVYKFALYRIETDSGKVLNETDYNKLHAFIQSGGIMVTEEG